MAQGNLLDSLLLRVKMRRSRAKLTEDETEIVKYRQSIKKLSLIEGLLFLFLVPLAIFPEVFTGLLKKNIAGTAFALVFGLIIVRKIALATCLQGKVGLLHDGLLTCVIVLFPALALYSVPRMEFFLAGSVIWEVICLVTISGILAFIEPKLHDGVNRIF